MSSKTIEAPFSLPIYFNGPPISEKNLPGFFYFALSGSDSLSLDPFNQPVTFLNASPIRCFSFTLPFHEEGRDPNKAMNHWADEFRENPDFLDSFLKECLNNIHYLIDQQIVDPNKMAVGGLSRGGFIATHLAALEPRLKYLVGFAPMTRLMALSELQKEQALLQTLSAKSDLQNVKGKLVDTHIRFYIGNRDLRVGTKHCFDFIQAVTETSYDKGHRSPSVEMIISPSVGFKGHGTLPPVFEDGALWIKKNLLG